jgi:WbqC-like protein family
LIVTAHQPNYLPGVSVIDKVEKSDIVIWLDEVQFTKGGWTNRQRMPDGSWLTIPLQHPQMLPINELRIDNRTNWRYRHSKTLRQHYGDGVAPICDAIERPHDFLFPLTLHLLILLLSQSPTKQYLQSEVNVKSGPSISEQLAAMVYALDGDVYLSGSSGRSYLDETPFLDRGMTVRYAEPTQPNACVLSRYLDTPV